MIKAAECAGMHTTLSVWRGESMLAARESSCSSTVKSVCCMKSASRVEVLAICENSAVRYVTVMIEKDVVVMPVESPVTPSPPESAKEANSKTESPRQDRAFHVQSGIPIPIRPHRKRLSIDQPRVVFRHVDNLRISGLDHNGLARLADFFLRRTLQVSRLLRAVAHDLNSSHHILLLVDVGVAER